MNVLNCSRLSFATLVATAIFAMLPTITLAQSTNYRFEPNSTLVFGSQLNPLETFDISGGTFTLNENSNAATFTNVVLDLSPQVPFFLAPDVILEDFSFSELLSNATQTVYQPPQFITIGTDPFPVPGNTLLISVDTESADRLVTFSGDINFSPPVSDQPFFGFSATAVAVPEPTGLPVCLLLAITFIARRKRGRSSALA